MADGPGAAVRHHTLSVLVENKAGVLARVASLFARRGYNIYSLAVAPTDDERFSRITIVVDAESSPLEQITKQLFKLINVVKISELHPDDSIERELLLVTVKAVPENRGQVMELVQDRSRHLERAPHPPREHCRLLDPDLDHVVCFISDDRVEKLGPFDRKEKK